jgi:signal transduction histidine kinase
MVIPLIYKVILFVINISAVYLAFWVYFANPRSRINKLFFILTFFFLFWVTGGYFFNSSSNLKFALILGRLLLGIGFLSNVLLYFFSLYFPVFKKDNLYIEKIIFLMGVIVFFITTFTSFVVKDVKVSSIGVEPIYHPIGMIFYYISLLIAPLMALKNFFKKYFIIPPELKIKIQYFLIGLSIFIITNIIFNIFLPLIRGSIQYWQIGNYSIIFFLAFTAYAIVKKELFGIKVVLTSIFVVAIAILLFVDLLFLTSQKWMMVVKGITFCLFLIFGRSLILSVIHEISLRERLEKAYEELKKLDTAKSEFISMASHQLRTPLSAIKGYISMIIEGSYGQIPELVKEKLQNVFTSNERLIQIVNTLLDISKIDLGKMEIKKEPVQIEEIIQSCYDDLKIEAQKKGLIFVFEKPETPLPKINADPLRIRQVFMNLIDNAIKYTPKGEIKMIVSQKGNSILFSIKDSGAGLTEKERKEIFQSFTRGSAGFDYFIEGTGLGLSIAKKITELHQGKIWAESEGKDKGSTFFVEIPIQ